MKDKFSLFIGLLLCCSTFPLIYGQKTEFVVPQKMEVLENKISDFENPFIKSRGAQAASASVDGSEFSTNIELENMEFNGKSNPYLILGLNKGAKAKQFIQRASWMITLKKQSKNSTKVSLELTDIIADRWSKKEVDTKTTKSTGKLEAEVKTFLLDKSIKPSENSDYSGYDGNADTASASVDEADIEAIIAAGDVQRNKKTTVSKKLQNLFGKQFIALPTGASFFTKSLKTTATEKDCADCDNGKYSNWDFEDFNLIYAKMNSGEEFYALQYYGDVKVKGLPYDLVFNDSSPEECKIKFARYKAQLYQTTVNIDDNTANALTVVDFKHNNLYVRLEFGNEYLTRIKVSNKQID